VLAIGRRGDYGMADAQHIPAGKRIGGGRRAGGMGRQMRSELKMLPLPVAQLRSQRTT
jgi:hypothetical protein